MEHSALLLPHSCLWPIGLYATTGVFQLQRLSIIMNMNISYTSTLKTRSVCWKFAIGLSYADMNTVA